MPWETVPGPFRWVPWVALTGVAIMIAPVLFEDPGDVLFLTGLGLVVLSGALLYEGLRTGTIRDRDEEPRTYSDSPFLYIVLVAGYVLFLVLGIAITCMNLFGWPYPI